MNYTEKYEQAIKLISEKLPLFKEGDFKPELSHSLGAGFRLLHAGYSGDVENENTEPVDPERALDLLQLR